MSYSAPAGNNVDINFETTYSDLPLGNAVLIDFANPPFGAALSTRYQMFLCL